MLLTSTGLARTMPQRQPISAGETGAVILIVPGILGCAVWSPSLSDRTHLSSQGIEFIHGILSKYSFKK